MKFRIVFLTLFMCCTCFLFVYAENIDISSKAGVAIDADSGVILYNKDMDEKIYPASTTKILTAILAIENLNLDQTVVVSKTAISIPWDSSSIYLKEDEVITIEHLLYGLLLNSGNDAANVLAEAVSGDIQTFVSLMNLKAKEIGCTNTHFNNAHGYSDDEHYTTALDMAKIFKYCIQNEKFVEIISTKKYIIPETNKTDEKRYLSNTNRLIQTKEDSIYGRYYEYCIGGKTGYTDEAGRTLVTFGKKDGKTVIITLFGASSSGSQDIRYTDAINIFEYSFNNFSKKTLAKKDDYTFNYINANKNLNYTVGLKEDLDILVNNNSNYNVTYTINIDDEKLKDIDENNFNELKVGTINFNFYGDNQEYFSTSQDIYLKDITKYSIITTKSIATIFIVILVVIILVSIILIILCFKKHKNSTNSKTDKFKKTVKIRESSRKDRRK